MGNGKWEMGTWEIGERTGALYLEHYLELSILEMDGLDVFVRKSHV
jgi:hypothetical protein